MVLGASFIILLQLGSLHVEAPFVLLGQVVAILYFAWFLLLLPIIGCVEQVMSHSLEGVYRDRSVQASRMPSMAMSYSTSRLHQSHPFHLVGNSPWPLLNATMAGSLAGSVILSLYGAVNSGLILLLTTITMVGLMALWFRDVVTEGGKLGDHTGAVVQMLTMGMVLFIVTEAMLFMAIFWAFFHGSLSPAVELGSMWPPLGVVPLDPAAIPTLNTVLLLSSGATITWSHHAFLNGNRTSALIGGAITIVLACVFTGFQAYEYVTATFTMSDGVYGSIFYFGTGGHGLHVIVGTIMIAVGLMRLYAYQLTTTHHVGMEAAILYWHFVDIVWLVLYVVFYWWGS